MKQKKVSPATRELQCVQFKRERLVLYTHFIDAYK